jgi:hypothetical protein
MLAQRRIRRDDTPIRRRQMILATTKVEDFDRFLEIFSTKGAEKRKQHGSQGSTVFRDPTEDGPRVGALRLGCGRLAELRV